MAALGSPRNEPGLPVIGDRDLCCGPSFIRSLQTVLILLENI